MMEWPVLVESRSKFSPIQLFLEGSGKQREQKSSKVEVEK